MKTGLMSTPHCNSDARLVRAEAGYAVDLGGQEVRAAVDATCLGAGADIKLGVRPEHLPVGTQGAGIGVGVRHVERLGDVSLPCVDHGRAALTVRVEGSVRPAGGAPLTLRLIPANLHLFDSSGRACERTVELPT